MELKRKLERIILDLEDLADERHLNSDAKDAIKDVIHKLEDVIHKLENVPVYSTEL